MNAQTQIAERQQPTAVQRLEHQLSERTEMFKQALPAHITPERFQRTVITAALAEPALLQADRTSFLLACLKAAQDGLLPDKREAALVIFKRRFKDAQGRWDTAIEVQYMPMVYGLRKKILQSGEISALDTAVVYAREEEEGRFIYEKGTEAMLRHRPMLNLSPEEVADDKIIAAYSVAVMKDGTKSFEVLPRHEIDKIRECSQTGALFTKKGERRDPSGPWVDWFSEQARKSAMRRHSKMLPMSGDLLDVEARDDELYARSSQAALEAAPPTPTLGQVGGAPAIEHQPDNSVPLDANIAQGAQPEPVRQTAADQRDPVTGMTQVSEDEARALDAQAGDPGPGSDMFGEPATDQGGNNSLAAEAAKSIVDSIMRATTITDIKAAEQHYARDRVAFDFDTCEDIERELASAKRRLNIR